MKRQEPYNKTKRTVCQSLSKYLIGYDKSLNQKKNYQLNNLSKNDEIKSSKPLIDQNSSLNNNKNIDNQLLYYYQQSLIFIACVCKF